ncbi:flagellar basal body P-ring formation chaperone FlgA [Azonexus sp. IMCC34839]|uniref:flagellar basal body P-ring formation chaperone FlgA n=1 Tax=Azonexus sp. IMCC34839 TaxID=3133695 RepID=UPI00399BAA4E
MSMIDSSAIFAGKLAPTSPLRQNGDMRRLQQLLVLLALLLPYPLLALDGKRISETAQHFVLQQLSGNKGEAKVNVGNIDTSRLPDCEAPEAFLPAGARLIGRVYIGIRCNHPHRWSVLVPVQISITGTYLTLNRALAAGQIVQANDILVTKGDISSLPTGAIADIETAVGKQLRNSLGAGQTLRADHLQSPWVVRQGQLVKIISQGNGFSISSEGQALNNAAEGQAAQVRMPSGQTISGIAQKDGSVIIVF